MSAPRFYLPQLPQLSAGLLDGPEARHATSVLRLSVNDHLYLFDGQGGEALARVTATARGHVEFEILQRVDRDRELSQQLTLAIALPKGDRQRTLVDAATELGVTDFVPLRTQRGVAQPTDKALERLQRSVVEASKQCGRNRLMRIAPPQSVAELIDSRNGLKRMVAQSNISTGAMAIAEYQPLCLVAHPYDEAGTRFPLRALLDGPSRAVAIAIGPEGGFTEEEVGQMVAQQWQVIDLGMTILRVEIAAIAAVAQAAAWLRPDSPRPTTCD